MTTIPNCPHCSLPLPMCSCSTPDAVYYPVVHARLDIKIEREISPEESMSDYDKSRAFIQSYLYGMDMKGNGYLDNCDIIIKYPPLRKRIDPRFVFP